jgi:hypothetical protein
VPAESRNELKGCNQKDFAKRLVNKVLAKGKTANAVKAQKGHTRFSDNQPHNEAAKTEQVAHGNVHSEKSKARQTQLAD